MQIFSSSSPFVFCLGLCVCLLIFKNVWCFLHTKCFYLSIFHCIWISVIVKKPHPVSSASTQVFLQCLWFLFLKSEPLPMWSFPDLGCEVWTQFSLFLTSSLKSRLGSLFCFRTFCSVWPVGLSSGRFHPREHCLLSAGGSRRTTAVVCMQEAP